MNAKVDVQLEESDDVVIKLGANKIVVKTHIPLRVEVELITQYLLSYFNTLENALPLKYSPHDYVGAEYAFMLALLDAVTDINVETINVNSFQFPELFDLVTAQVKNYPLVRKHLDAVVEDVKQEDALQRSVGGILQKFSENGMGILEKIKATLDSDPEKALAGGRKLLREIEESSVGRLFEETKKATTTSHPVKVTPTTTKRKSSTKKKKAN